MAIEFTQRAREQEECANNRATLLRDDSHQPGRDPGRVGTGSGTGAANKDVAIGLFPLAASVATHFGAALFTC